MRTSSSYVVNKTFYVVTQLTIARMNHCIIRSWTLSINRVDKLYLPRKACVNFVLELIADKDC